MGIHDAGVVDVASLEGVICTLGVEVDDVDGGGGLGVQEGRGEDVHPAGADDEAGLLGEDDGGQPPV